MFNRAVAVDQGTGSRPSQRSETGGSDVECDASEEDPGGKNLGFAAAVDRDCSVGLSPENKTVVTAGPAVVGLVTSKCASSIATAIVSAISRALTTSGHPVRFLEADESLVEQVKRVHPDVCVNLAASVKGPLGDALVPALVESCGVPCVGAPAATLALLRDRATCLRALRDAGVPVPAFDVVFSSTSARVALQWPLRVTSAVDGVSSVVQDANDLSKAVAASAARGQPALVEEAFVDGRTFAVAVMGNRSVQGAAPSQQQSLYNERGFMVLPMLEVVDSGSGEVLSPVDLDTPTFKLVADTAIATVEALKLVDFTRVDVHVDPSEQQQSPSVCVVAVRGLPGANPLPFFELRADLGLPALVGELVELALHRCGSARAPPAAAAKSQAGNGVECAGGSGTPSEQDDEAYLIPSTMPSQALRTSCIRKSEVPPEKWNDWRWQFANRLTRLEQFESFLTLTDDERSAFKHPNLFPVAVTPHFASLINPSDPDDPIRHEVLPRMKEFEHNDEDLEDSLGEDAHMPVKGLVHRYPDRVLMLVSMTCASYCRFCTRNRVVGNKSVTSCHAAAGETEGETSENVMTVYQRQIEYIRDTPQIRDVLLSGGDPLLLPLKTLDWLLTQIRAIPHVQVVRIGSRVPIFLPQRVTDELCQMLRKHHPLWMNVHINHPNELCPEAERALGKLADAGIPLGSQTVLLAGVNDCPNIMLALMQRIVQCRVRPYYIYQCDLVVGAAHFRTPVTKGIEILEAIRGHTSGFCVPTYVIDAPHGGGKVPILPNYLLSLGDTRAVVRNYEGFIATYTGPKYYHLHDADGCKYCRTHTEYGQEGISGLLEGVGNAIHPVNWDQLHARAARYQERKHHEQEHQDLQQQHL